MQLSHGATRTTVASAPTTDRFRFRASTAPSSCEVSRRGRPLAFADARVGAVPQASEQPSAAPSLSPKPAAPAPGAAAVRLRAARRPEPSEDVIILGSGPAGLTAAIYAGRAALRPLVFEGRDPGGQLVTTDIVENYPGFAEGVDGYELMSGMREQAERFGARLVAEHADAVDLSAHPFKVSAGGQDYYAKSLIIATGASPRRLGLEGEGRLSGRGVSFCATCDGPLPAFRDQDVIVVGGGDSAMTEALFLARFARKVTVVHRRNDFRASQILVDRARQNDKIEIRTPFVVDAILGAEQVEQVRLRSTATDETETLDVAGVFVAIGHQPNIDLVRDQLALTDRGRIATRGKGTATSRDGVFACGDVQDGEYQQAVTAAASGCKAAIDAERWLDRASSAASDGVAALQAA